DYPLTKPPPKQVAVRSIVNLIKVYPPQLVYRTWRAMSMPIFEGNTVCFDFLAGWEDGIF
ncbi:MAG: hypothetical protein J7M40_14275, partial [Planctomycetes bacterium]|nr:hypothetical protein [Planctomycetota bacterium]